MSIFVLKIIIFEAEQSCYLWYERVFLMSNYYGQNQNNLLVKRQTDNTTPGVNAKRKKTVKIKERKVKCRAKNV